MKSPVLCVVLVCSLLGAAGCRFSSISCGNECECDEDAPVFGIRCVTVGSKLDVRPLLDHLRAQGVALEKAVPVVRVDILDSLEVECARMHFTLRGEDAKGGALVFSETFFFSAVMAREDFTFRLPHEKLSELSDFLKRVDVQTLSWKAVFGYERMRVSKDAPETFFTPLKLKTIVRFDGVKGEIVYPDASLSATQRTMFKMWSWLFDMPSLKDYFLERFINGFDIFPNDWFLDDGSGRVRKALKIEAKSMENLVGRKKYREAAKALRFLMEKFDGENGGDPSDDVISANASGMFYHQAEEIAVNLEILA